MRRSMSFAWIQSDYLGPRCVQDIHKKTTRTDITNLDYNVDKSEMCSGGTINKAKCIYKQNILNKWIHFKVGWVGIGLEN